MTEKSEDLSYNCIDGTSTQNLNNDTMSTKLLDSKSTISNVFNKEQMRLESFNGWTITFIDKCKLALFGFYYIGPNDAVKCNFCDVEVGGWERGDNILVEHLRWSPRCPLLRRSTTENIPIDLNLLQSSLPPETSIDCVTDFVEFRHNAFIDSELVTVKTNNLDYSEENNRLKSFEDWPIALKQKPHELAEAGFYYIGKGDQVRCFNCGAGLKDWQEKDIPWETHALINKDCSYLKLVKGHEYINDIRNFALSKSTEKEEYIFKIYASNKDSDNSVKNQSAEKTSQEKQNKTFMRCILCEKCTLCLQQCLICRENVIDK